MRNARKKGRNSLASTNMLPLVIFEDKDLLVINKPAGWITNEASTTSNTPVLQTWLSKNFSYSISGNSLLRSGVVHRLDKDTSGILLVAKNEKLFLLLQNLFFERKVQKTYAALLHGKLEPGQGSIDANVGRLPWNRERFGVLPGGREAQTDYKVVNYYKKGSEKFSLVEFYPKTGRTHQLRIHAKHINHPIVADNFYAGRKTARGDKLWCPRLFLHADSISFSFKGDLKSFSCDLPSDLSSALLKLQKTV